MLRPVIFCSSVNSTHPAVPSFVCHLPLQSVAFQLFVYRLSLNLFSSTMDEANLPEGGDAIGDGEGGAAANNVNVNVNVIGNVDEDDTDNGSANAPAAAAAVAVAAADPAASQNRSSRSSSRPRRPPHRLVEELNRRHLGQREGGGGGGGGDRNNINAGRGRRGNRIGALRRQHQQYQQYRRGAPQHQPPLSRAVLVENSHEDDCDDWEELSPPELATWPKATPTPTGERYLSVCCDGIGWAWTNYAGADERFHPTVLWRYVPTSERAIEQANRGRFRLTAPVLFLFHSQQTGAARAA